MWIDTCCIDKESSAELSEAINSMFSYYATANICYAYLADVVWRAESSGSAASDAFYDEDETGDEAVRVAIQSSRWFTRGWTLQELIAPSELVFFGSTWNCIRSKRQIRTILSVITDIDGDALQGGIEVLGSCSCTAKMGSSAKPRLEDRAYCLMGLFDVNMPLLYGEGTKAFQRLQEEILQRSEDQSLLAWNCKEPRLGSWSTGHQCALLAPSPEYFAGMSNVVR